MEATIHVANLPHGANEAEGQPHRHTRTNRRERGRVFVQDAVQRGLFIIRCERKSPRDHLVQDDPQ